MKALLKLLSPVPLVTASAGGLMFLAGWTGHKLGLPYYAIAAMVVAIAIIWVLVLWILKLRAARAGTALERSLDEQAKSQLASARPGRESEIEQLRTQMLEAIQALKASKVGKGKGESALYVLPWYMIIGPPATGKTTLLQNSGLNFPYLDPARSRSPVRGVGGTRNCDWWFSDEAVILDTAGRYVLPVEADDTQEWLGFLDLLRRFRGRKPLNGLIVCVSVSDLLAAGDEEIEGHAQKIRNRIDELIKQLRLSFPVYIVFTKCDLMRGFVETFGDLSRAERAQAWGATVARDRFAREPAWKIFEEEMDRLVEAAAQAKVPRLAVAQQVETRPEILFFPQQFAALKPKLSRFLEVLFRANPYQEMPVFRGFYFTSGTQEGRPIDQVINVVLRGFGVDAGDGGMVVEPSQAKAYFIDDVFTKVAFPDRNMAGPSAHGERKRRAMRVRTFIAGAAVLAVFLVLLIGLFTANSALVGQAKSLSERSLAALSGTEHALPLQDLELLDRLRQTLLRMDKRDRPLASLAYLGTYQGDRMAVQGRQAALVVLRERSLEPALPFLAERLRANDPSQGEADFRSYVDWYRAWLLAQDPAEWLSSPQAARSAARALTDHWAAGNPGGDAEKYQRLMYDQLLFATRARDLLAVVIPSTQRPDAGVASIAEASIRRAWTAENIYPSLAVSAPNLAPVTLVSITGGDVGLASDGQVPGLYTKSAFGEFRGDVWAGPAGEFVAWVRELERDPVMLRAYGGQPSGMQSELLRRYAAEYERAWGQFFSSVQAKPGMDDAGVRHFLDLASGEDSPVLKLLRSALENARFEAGAPAELGELRESFGTLEDFFTKPGGNVVLRRIREWGGKEVAPSAEYLQLVKDLSADFDKIGDRPESAPAVTKLETWIRRHVDSDAPMTGAVAHVLRLPALAVTKTREHGRAGELEAAWQGVFQEFAQNLAGRYPLSAGAARWVATSDFEAFFGPEGTFHSFYRESLAGILNEDGSPRDPNVRVNPAVSTAVQKAYRIRRAFFQDGGRLGFRLTLRTAPPERPAGVNFLSSRLSIGGGSLQFRSVQPRPEEMAWPGARPDDGASLTFDLRGTADAQPLSAEGVWGFFHLLDRASVVPGAGGSVDIRWEVPTTKGNLRVTYTAIGLPAAHPLERGLLRFSLPDRLLAGP